MFGMCDRQFTVKCRLPIEEQISARQDKFKLRYCASKSVVCRAIYY